MIQFPDPVDRLVVFSLVLYRFEFRSPFNIRAFNCIILIEFDRLDRLPGSILLLLENDLELVWLIISARADVPYLFY